MNILFVTSELRGFAQQGGVADVTRALAPALHNLGHDVRVVLPYYQEIARHEHLPVVMTGLRVPMGNRDEICAVRETTVDDVRVYFIEHDGFFDRPLLYNNEVMGEYADNGKRFGFLSKAALQLCKEASFRPQVAHANDWATALVPFFLRVHEDDGYFAATASVITVHNTLFQGKYPGDHREFIGIPDEYYVPDIIEDNGGINFLKAGVYFADRINAVSPNYAIELLTPEGSHGLQQYFLRRQQDVRGILNGCDYRSWNPATDPLIPTCYAGDTLASKAICKQALQNAFSLEVDSARPLFGMVSRLAEQKGFYYLLPILKDILREDAQLVILGSGEQFVEHCVQNHVEAFRGQMGYRREYDERLARWIYAGSDCFLMPSLFEPCGLSAMYGMSYGAVPLVRAVGGLTNIVQDFDLNTGAGTGFVFNDPCRDALYLCIRRVIDTWRDHRAAFTNLARRAMAKRFEWSGAAETYCQMYSDAVESRCNLMLGRMCP